MYLTNSGTQYCRNKSPVTGESTIIFHTTVSHHNNFPHDIFPTIVSHTTASHSTISHSTMSHTRDFQKTVSYHDSISLDNVPTDIFKSRQFLTVRMARNDTLPLYDIFLLKIILLNLLYQGKVFGLFVNYTSYTYHIIGNEF